MLSTCQIIIMVVGQGAMYELVQQPNDSDYESNYNSDDDDPNGEYLIKLLTTNFGKNKDKETVVNLL